jgi:hypothetical protein
LFHQAGKCFLDYAEQQKQTSRRENISIICFIEDDKTVLRQQLDKMKTPIISVFFVVNPPLAGEELIVINNFLSLINLKKIISIIVNLKTTFT